MVCGLSSRSIFLATLTCGLISGCGGGGSGGDNVAPPRTITTMAVSPSDATLEALGATAQLEAVARDQNGNALSATFSWSSSDTDVVSVDSSGRVTAVNNGMATVTVRHGAVSASAAVTVQQKPARITLPQDAILLTALGANQQLEASILDANGNTMTSVLTWTSSDPAIAAVDANGKVTAQANGTATVTAGTGSISASATVTVEQAVSSVELLPETVILTAIGQRAQLAATALDANGHPVAGDVRFTSSDSMVADVDGEGLVSALRNGMSTVTASAGSVSGTATVTVMQVLAGIAVVPDAVTLSAIGESAQLEITGRDANGYPVAVDVDLSSSDPSVATVSAAGRVTAYADGTVTVTALAGTISGAAVVTVDRQVASVSLAPVDATALQVVGATLQLQAAARDANGHTMPVEFDWASSDRSVATVDRAGLVTARADGMAEITASAGGFFDALTLELALREVAAVIVTPSSALLEAFDATVQLEVEVLDADGQPMSVPVQWASSDPSVAAVGASGLITARGNGTVTITARGGARSGTATVRVLQAVRRIQLTPEPPRNPDRFLFTSLGETVQFTAEAFDANRHPIMGAVFTARSRDSSVVSIDDQLLATAIGNGDTNIDIYSEFSGRSTVLYQRFRVRQVAASIEIEPAARTFRTVGESYPFTAAARDANGHPLAAELMSWESADRRVADVDTAGLVSIAGVGDTTIRVLTAEGLSASATVTGDLRTACEAGDRAPTITSVDPVTLVEGATIVIQGLGFCPESSGNLVTVDRTVAAVEALSETRLSVTVPQYDCLPFRRVELGVAVGRSRAARMVELEPDEEAVSVPVGRQAIWGAGVDKCLQFPAVEDEETYVIGVQSTLLDEVAKLTPVRLIASTSEPDAGKTATPTRSGTSSNSWRSGFLATASATGGPTAAAPPDEPDYETAFDPIQLSPALHESVIVAPIATGTITFPDQGDIESLPEEGDLVTIPDRTQTWVVYKVGARALWLVDTDYVGRLETRYPGRIEALSEAFDNSVYPAISDYFGAPDLGNVDRVVITIDARGGQFAVAKQSRRWYRIVLNASADDLALAHEFVHIVQIAGAWGRPHPRSLWPAWFGEGQAQIGEELYAMVQSNRTTGQNYGRSVVYDNSPLADGWRYSIVGLRNFFGGAHSGRPQECAWRLPNVTPCGRGWVLLYTVGWSILRYITDQYGLMHPGGEASLHRELIHGPDSLIETIEQQMGEPMETLLARWAAALYVDDRIPNLDPHLQFTTWNLYDIYRDDPERLMPLEIGFSDQEQRARIRDGSFWYVDISGSQRPATAIRVRDLADRDLPDDMQVWIVRLQ